MTQDIFSTMVSAQLTQNTIIIVFKPKAYAPKYAHTHTHTRTHTHTHYGDVSGYKLNMRKCGVVLQGIDWHSEELPISGFHVQRKVKYLGTWLGNATIMEQFQGPLANLQAKAQFLATLPLTESEKLQALHLYTSGRTRCCDTWRSSSSQPHR